MATVTVTAAVTMAMAMAMATAMAMAMAMAAWLFCLGRDHAEARVKGFHILVGGDC